MALSPKLQERVEALAEELRRELYGPKGYPPWGTKFADMEEETGEVGDALACAMLSQSETASLAKKRRKGRSGPVFGVRTRSDAC
jgi:hypothetical protein